MTSIEGKRDVSDSSLITVPNGTIANSTDSSVDNLKIANTTVEIAASNAVTAQEQPLSHGNTARSNQTTENGARLSDFVMIAAHEANGSSSSARSEHNVTAPSMAIDSTSKEPAKGPSTIESSAPDGTTGSGISILLPDLTFQLMTGPEILPIRSSFPEHQRLNVQRRIFWALNLSQKLHLFQRVHVPSEKDAGKLVSHVVNERILRTLQQLPPKRSKAHPLLLKRHRRGKGVEVAEISKGPGQPR
jgi:hypothetical protein